jgi:predicted RNA-binding protein associated with RNAse of E/G family
MRWYSVTDGLDENGHPYKFYIYVQHYNII